MFEEGIRLTLNAAQASLVHTLFAVRSRAVRENLSAPQAQEFLSGQTIGADVKGAVDTLRALVDIKAGVTLIGTPELNERYAIALNAIGVASSAVDGAGASNAGLYALYRRAVSGKQAA
jgi:2-dehydro-3-deoxygalactonokinase